MSSVRSPKTILSIAAAIVLAVPAAASAHAGLIATIPAGDAVVAASPSELVLTFSEPVIASAGAVRVLDGVARPVPIERLRQAEGGKQIVVPLERSLRRGSYTVVWKVISLEGASRSPRGDAQAPCAHGADEVEMPR